MNTLPDDADDDSSDDLIQILPLKSIISVGCGNQDRSKNTSKIKDAESIGNLEISVKDQISISSKSYQCEDNSMKRNIYIYNDMLLLNKRIVSSLLDLKRHLSFALAKCERKLATVEKSLQKHTTGDAKVLICNAGMPYFKDRHYFFAFNNEDEILKEKYKELQFRNLPKVSSWTTKRRNTLLEAIQSARLDNAMLRSRAKIEKISKGKAQFPPTDFLEMISPLREKEFDWLKISSTHFENIYSPLNCSVMWKVFLHPDVNKNRWTKPEDKKLKEIVKKYKSQNWDEITQELNTNRTAYQCFVRYNTTKTLPKKNCNWKSEEDDRLLKLIEIFEIGDFIPWGEVAGWMRNRTKQQVYFRWAYSLAPHLIKGRFTKIEDDILMDAVTKYGTNFRKISAVLMPNRSTVQLHDRYQILSTNQIEKWNLWTLEEDTKLLSLSEQIGPNWSVIAKKFSCKTRTQLRHRHTALQKYIKRGVSLFELHKNRAYIENEKEEEQKKEKFTKNCDDNHMEKELIEYFHTKYKLERFVHKSKLCSVEKSKRNAIRLYNVLQMLNVRICIPNEINDIKLNDKDWQLLCSLREYMRNRNDKKQRFAIIDKYKSLMFSTNEAKEDSYFVPPPPFDSQIKLRKSEKSQCIDYNLNTNNNFLLEQPMGFDTPDYVISYIGGNEQELQFQKFSYLLQVNDSKYEGCLNVQNCTTLSTKLPLRYINNDSDQNNASNNMLKTIKFITHFDIDTTSLENDGELCVQTIKQQDTLFNNHEEEKCSSSSSGTETTQKHDTPMIYASHATLLSLKNLIYLKQLNEMCNIHGKFFIRTHKFQKAINLLESRLEQLFKYPIGLSKIALPKIYVMDTFLYNDITPKRRKSSEISGILEKHKTKKLITLSEKV